MFELKSKRREKNDAVIYEKTIKKCVITNTFRQQQLQKFNNQHQQLANITNITTDISDIGSANNTNTNGGYNQ